MRVELTFNNVWDGKKLPTAVIDFDLEKHIEEELEEAAKGQEGWARLQEMQWKLKEILADDMSVNIIH